MSSKSIPWYDMLMYASSTAIIIRLDFASDSIIADPISILIRQMPGEILCVEQGMLLESCEVATSSCPLQT